MNLRRFYHLQGSQSATPAQTSNTDASTQGGASQGTVKNTPSSQSSTSQNTSPQNAGSAGSSSASQGSGISQGSGSSQNTTTSQGSSAQGSDASQGSSGSNSTITGGSGAASTNNQSGRSLHSIATMQINGFPLWGILAIILAVILIIIVIYLCIRRRKNLQLYEKSPANFSRKPKLSFFQWTRSRIYQIKSFFNQQPGQKYSVVQKNSYEGQYYQIITRQSNSCLYYDRQLTGDCYFQVQIIRQTSYFQIGFIPCENTVQYSKSKLKLKENKQEQVIQLDKYGVSFSSDGNVIANGEKKFSCDFALEQGDILGIGMTIHSTGIRIWTTKNGVILNPATDQQAVKNVDFQNQEHRQKTAKAQNKQEQKQKDNAEQKKTKQQYQLLRRRIWLKIPKKRKFYAVFKTDQQEQSDPTIVNWNIGKHTFRLFDGNKLGGLLD